jgi:membrane-bound inhibitor of C-type lysozyme
MSENRNKIGAAIAGLVLLGGGLIAAQPASAAQSTQTFLCGEQPLTVRTNNNNSSEHGGWGAGIVVDGGSGHLIPTAFSGSLYDVTTGTTVFDFNSAKADGKANPNQQTITCSATQLSTLGEFAGPGNPLPPGTSATDAVVFTVSVTAVPKA